MLDRPQAFPAAWFIAMKPSARQRNESGQIRGVL